MDKFGDAGVSVSKEMAELVGACVGANTFSAVLSPDIIVDTLEGFMVEVWFILAVEHEELATARRSIMNQYALCFAFFNK